MPDAKPLPCPAPRTRPEPRTAPALATASAAGAGSVTGAKSAAGPVSAAGTTPSLDVRPAASTKPASRTTSATSTPPAVCMNAADVRPFLTALAAASTDEQTELAFTDPFTLLVAVVLSAQATDASVNRATPALFKQAPTPAAMAALGADGIGRCIRSVGLWQSKARNVAGLSAMLVERHAGEVPRDRASLEALPGVGRKTANVVLNVAFGEATMAVDTHIFRLGNRTGLAPGKDVRAVENALLERIPGDMLRPAHHWLILHGRYVCKARLPECWRCPAVAWCGYPDKVLVAPLRRRAKAWR